MSAKWSVFPVAAQVLNADILASVQGGLNKQYTRAKLLTSFAGEIMQLVDTGGSVLKFDGLGNVLLDVNLGKQLTLSQNTTPVLAVDVPGNLTIQAPGGNLRVAYNGGNTFSITDTSTAYFDVDGFGTVGITAGPTGDLNFVTALGAIQISAAGHVGIVDGSGSSAVVTYVPSAPGNWAGSPPDQATAIDRLAAVVSLGGASPIP